MILFSVEFYSRKVWSVSFVNPKYVHWNDVAFLQTYTITKWMIGSSKAILRIRYWQDRNRLGWEWKWSKTLCQGKNSKFVVQKKLGFYVYCFPLIWKKWFLCFIQPKTKIRQVLVLKNLRITLDNKKKLEIKIHKTPII